MTASPWRSLVLTLAAMAVVVLALHVAFPDHPDYAGHFSAGAGMTLGGLSVLLLWHEKPAPGRATALALAAVAVGALTEATIFRLADFDVVDFGVQSIGAALATYPFLSGATIERNLIGILAGLALVGIGVGHIVWLTSA